MLLALISQVALAAIIQHYCERWLILFCFAMLSVNIYYFTHWIDHMLRVIHDEIALRFLAAETKSGITENDLKAAHERRLLLVGPEEAKKMRERRYFATPSHFRK